MAAVLFGASLEVFQVSGRDEIGRVAFEIGVKQGCEAVALGQATHDGPIETGLQRWPAQFTQPADLFGLKWVERAREQQAVFAGKGSCQHNRFVIRMRCRPNFCISAAKSSSSDEDVTRSKPNLWY